MAISANFTASQTIGSPSIINLEDTSTGSDASISARRIYLRKYDGNYLVPSGTSTSYIEWPYADSTTEVDVLDKDYALEITIAWVNSVGANLYTKTTLYVFTLYSEEFYYGLTQDQAGAINIVQDANYYRNKMILRVEIDSANQAVSLGSDQAAAQWCLERAKQMIDNENFYF